MSEKFEWGKTPDELRSATEREKNIAKVASELEASIMNKMGELDSTGIGPEGMESALDRAVRYVRGKLNELK